MAFDVTCLGELVVDLMPACDVDGVLTYEPKPGGAPGNVAVGLARLGRRVAMISKVGGEAFGNLLVETLDHYGVNRTGVIRAADRKTGLAVVTIGPGGDREFVFYRDNAADLFLEPDDVAADLVTGSTVLHVNSLLMSAPDSAAAQSQTMALAREAGGLISVDLNFRPALWPSLEEMVQAGRDLIAKAAIVKASEDELFALSDRRTIEHGVRELWHPGLRAFAVTKGVRGAELFTESQRMICDGFDVDAIDTTGAGDAFAACLLSELIEVAFDLDQRPRLETALKRACAAGALTAMGKGAMGSMPDKTRIRRFLESHARAR